MNSFLLDCLTGGFCRRSLFLCPFVAMLVPSRILCKIGKISLKALKWDMGVERG